MQLQIGTEKTAKKEWQSVLRLPIASAKLSG